MFFSPWLIIPVVILVVVFALFTALVMFLREYAFRPKAYSPQEFAALLRKLDARECVAATRRLINSNYQEPLPSANRSRELTTLLG